MSSAAAPNFSSVHEPLAPYSRDAITAVEIDYDFEAAFMQSLQEQEGHSPEQDVDPQHYYLSPWDEPLSPLTTPPSSPPHCPNIDLPVEDSFHVKNASNTERVARMDDAQQRPEETTRKRKAKEAKRCRKRRKRQEKRAERDVFTEYTVSHSQSEKYQTPKVVKTELDACSLPATSTAFTGRVQPADAGVQSLEALKDRGMRVYCWDGRTPTVFQDKHGRIFTALAGQPTGDPTWLGAVQAPWRAAAVGTSVALSSGITHGGGGSMPGNLVPRRAVFQRAISRMQGDPSLGRLAGFQSSAFYWFAPKVYRQYGAMQDALHAHHPLLVQNFNNSVFPAATYNLGPQTVTRGHTDSKNLAYGWCALTALGTYDPTKGGHLVLFQLGLIIEFPPGSTILIPSAVLRHGNAPVQPGEERMSFAQYAAGALFQWVKAGFRTLKVLEVEDPERHRWVQSSGKKRTQAVLYEHTGAEPGEVEIIYSYTGSTQKNKRVRTAVLAAVPLEEHAFATAPNSEPAQEHQDSTFECVDHMLCPPARYVSAISSFEVGDEVPPEHIRDEVPGLVIIARPRPKRYETTAAPLNVWLPHRQEYLEEMHLHDGRMLYDASACANCGCEDPKTVCRELHPLHRIEIWKNNHWESTTLRNLGLMIQLGHRPAEICQKRVGRELVILHSNGIHKVYVHFCRCRGAVEFRQQLMRYAWWPATSTDPHTCATFNMLRSFHHLNLRGNVSAYDYYNALENMTDGWRLEPIPNRLRSFMLMIRQYRNMKALRRAGRAFDRSGVSGTGPGELAIRCRACPHPGINLPDSWQSVPPHLAFIYQLFLAQDANFRQKNRLRLTTYQDVCLSPGWSYFVETTEYMEHVKKFATQEEMSTCAGFMAMILANLKKARGLAATGVGGCMCSRHELWRPCGMGDLQRGERYCNMDFILRSAVYNICAGLVVLITYDIACQFFKNFAQRIETLPERFQRSTQPSSWVKKVPKGHLEAHGEACHGPYSLNYTPGAGATDGEAPERGWAELNHAAPCAKEMGPSARKETLDDCCQFHNWRKTVGFGDSLLRRLLHALKMVVELRKEFVAFHASIDQQHPGRVAEWRRMIDSWEADNSLPCPYQGEQPKVKVKDIRLALAREEEANASNNAAVLTESTPSAFIVEGLEIEKAQLELQFETSRRKDINQIEEVGRIERRTAIRRRLKYFFEAQVEHMPGLSRYTKSSTGDDVGTVAPPIHLIPLLLPSSLSPEGRRQVCNQHLITVEERLREAHCYEALGDLRTQLRTRQCVAAFKAMNAVGQGANTRARKLLESVDDKALRAKLRYRTNRAALLALRGPGEWERTLRELRDEDVRALNERALTAQEIADRKAARRHGGLDEEEIFTTPATLAKGTGEGTQTVSWIWTTSLMLNAAENDVDELFYQESAVRVEWAKARARARRWSEEVLLLEEEMRRVLQYCEAEEQKWLAAACDVATSDDFSPFMKEGLSGYAFQQAACERRLYKAWSLKWEAARNRAKELRADLEKTLMEDIGSIPLDVTVDTEESSVRGAEQGGGIEHQGDAGIAAKEIFVMLAFDDVYSDDEELDSDN
ncbi:hypothetical protein NM688_g5476 [Phlebia brevispora]|uniref:Uncharacterized protein n=1 Tax=Phlebia brevispora TaxID=194682 RepID=A0ACC1SUS3_9APHY|nr:hypothetical protein NM688_g5476 [Phlebia brevispora]